MTTEITAARSPAPSVPAAPQRAAPGIAPDPDPSVPAAPSAPAAAPDPAPAAAPDPAPAAARPTAPGRAPAAVVATPTGPDALAPAADTLATLVDEIAWALARRRAALTRRLGRRGVTGSQTMLLFHLRMRGDLPMGRLADLLGIGLPNLTGIVDRMEEHGLVERRRVPDDRRLVLVALTNEGRRIPEEIEGVQRELLVATFAALDEGRRRACLAALREATARTDDQDFGPGCTRPDASHDTTC